MIIQDLVLYAELMVENPSVDFIEPDKNDK